MGGRGSTGRNRFNLSNHTMTLRTMCATLAWLLSAVYTSKLCFLRWAMDRLQRVSFRSEVVLHVEHSCRTFKAPKKTLKTCMYCSANLALVTSLPQMGGLYAPQIDEMSDDAPRMSSSRNTS